MRGKRKQSKGKHSKKLLYIVSVSALIALVGVAFFSPGWVFGLQDGRQCRDTVLEERENTDVAVLSTNYETSFYQRMVNFAENRTESANFYVASEELTDYQKLDAFLKSDHGIYRDNILTLVDMGLLSEAYFSCEVKDWKQYVIYSDDYAKGVNFILWYIELESAKEEGAAYKFLVEANTGEVYGIHADWGAMWSDRHNKAYGDYNLSLNRFLGLSTYEDYLHSWETTAYFFSGITETNFYDWYSYYLYERGFMEVIIHEETDKGDANYDLDFVESTSTSKSYLLNTEWDEAEMTADELQWVEQWGDFLEKNPPLFRASNDRNRLEGTFPYGDSSLIFRIEIAESVPYPWKLQDITVGFPAVYELIPEFVRSD